jgi:beta-aspartyl-peptidase (threonine type)
VSTFPSGKVSPSWALAIHGGASGLPKNLSDQELQQIKGTLGDALETGRRILSAGGSSLDAVQASVRVMENSAVLNAGRGSVLNHEGFAELDAAIMDGKGRRAGAVAALRHVANPIDVARCVMDHGKHVLLVGSGAEQFAIEQGIVPKLGSYFVTERRLKELREVIEATKHPEVQADSPEHSKGTVGAVALDEHGNLAAATSTGGVTNKHWGRVGDSPLIGAGTYAEDGVCAVSATGAGEYFIRYMAASEVCARVKYAGKRIESAACEVINEIKAAGGEGGLIAIDAAGHVTMPYSSRSMIRGQVRSDGRWEVFLEASGSTGEAPAGPA